MNVDSGISSLQTVRVLDNPRDETETCTDLLYELLEHVDRKELVRALECAAEAVLVRWKSASRGEKLGQRPFELRDVRFGHSSRIGGEVGSHVNRGEIEGLDSAAFGIADLLARLDESEELGRQLDLCDHDRSRGYLAARSRSTTASDRLLLADNRRVAVDTSGGRRTCTPGEL